MIEQSQSIYYIAWAALCGAMGIAYIKFKSLEGQVITTKEFKVFQSGFLTGYSLVILCELIAAASFYHTFISLKLSLEQITKLYIITIVSSTATGIVGDIIDIGARKDKCVLSALLYSASMFSIFFGGHYEMLLIGRIVYGVASSLHHSSFESYAIQQHASLGFPDDWLAQTFSYLTHCMAIMAALSGILGQIAASTGHMGCVALCCVLFASIAVYLFVVWEKDMNSSKYMLSSFIFNMTQTVNTVRSNRQMLLFLLISSMAEASITIFTFYWAPWITSIVIEENHHLPYEILFSCLIVTSMLGNYLFQLFTIENNNAINSNNANSNNNLDMAFQAILVTSSVSYFLGAIFQTSFMAFLISIVVQLCMGCYWPAIGYFRGKIIPPELRSSSLTIARYVYV